MMNIDAAFREFQATFWTLVRSDPSEVVDRRRKNASQFLKISQKGLQAMIDEDLLLPSDVAAQISECVGVKNRSSIHELGGVTKRAEVVKVVDALLESESLPLGAHPEVPTADIFLDFLLTSARGKMLYRSIALLLDQAIDEPGLRVYLYYPNGRPNFKDNTTPSEPVRRDEDAEPKDLVDLLDGGGTIDDNDE